MRPLRSLALLLLAPLTLAAQPVPRAACPLPRVVTAAPLAGQPADVAVTEVASLTVQPVTVTDSAGFRCLGYAERVPGAKKIRWRAWRTERDGFLRVVANTPDSAWSARADAVRAIIATRPAPTPPVVVDPTPAPLTRDSLLGWPVRLAADSLALPAALRVAVATFDSAVLVWSEQHAATETAAWEYTYYDRPGSYYRLCARTGRARYCALADTLAVIYRDGYLVPALSDTAGVFGQGAGPSPHWSLLAGVTAHAERTGDVRSVEAVLFAARAMKAVHDINHTRGWDSDPRIEARTIEDLLLAERLASRFSAIAARVRAGGAAAWRADADSVVAHVLTRQTADGRWVGGVFGWMCGQQLNYQAGMIHTALIAAYLAHGPDPRIVTAVAKGSAFLASQWRGQGYGFEYATGVCVTRVGDLGPGAAADLTAMMVPSFAWLARVTGDAGWTAHGDVMAIAAVRDAYMAGYKQFNQALLLELYLGLR